MASILDRIKRFTVDNFRNTQIQCGSCGEVQGVVPCRTDPSTGETMPGSIYTTCPKCLAAMKNARHLTKSVESL